MALTLGVPASVTLENIRDQALTSLYGRRLGFDVNHTLVGTKGLRLVHQAITSATTASTPVTNYGVTTCRTTDSSGTTAGWNLADPLPGLEKFIVNLSSGIGVILTTAARIITTGASTGSIITLKQGQSVHLMGVSTGLWCLVGGLTVSSSGDTANAIV